MLVATALERKFIMKQGSQLIPLPDPDRKWSPDRVLQFYTTTHPILTTATIRGPEIKEDKQCFIFESTIGVKG